MPIAPISIRAESHMSSAPVSMAGVDLPGVTLAFPNVVVMVEGITEDPAARLRRLRAERKEYHV